MPTDDQVRGRYSDGAIYQGVPEEYDDQHLNDFDAWLARVKRDAAREALERAEHRIARLGAQANIRGRAVVMYRERAREAEARIQAVEDVLAAWHVEPGESGLADDLLRALNT